MTYRFTYQTFPGQTVVRRTTGEGYTFRELVSELAANGEGTITVDDEDIAVPEKSLLRRIEGKDCRELRRS